MLEDNIDVAILTRLNDLAERYGLKPYDFIASVRAAGERMMTTLTFEIPAQGNALREERYDKMLQAIGAGPEAGDLKGTPAQIIDALDNALQRAPRPHPRY